MIDEKYAEQTPKYVEQPPKKKMGKVKKILLIVAGSFLLLVILGTFVSAITPAPKQDATPQHTTTTQTAPKQATPQPATPKPTQQATPQDTAKRDVTGKYTALGAGTFQGGKDVVSGTYDVTAPGQMGNFMVEGSDTYNEIFGQGVTKVRATISDGDKITLSGLDSVIFTPVTSDYITSHSKVTLYAGTFVVGQDIGAGRYVATTVPGASGNFIVSNGTNEILGKNDFGGVSSVSVDLADGDVITISSLSQVTMTPVA
jgi:hypothetical protein